MKMKVKFKSFLTIIILLFFSKINIVYGQSSDKLFEKIDD